MYSLGRLTVRRQLTLEIRIDKRTPFFLRNLRRLRYGERIRDRLAVFQIRETMRRRADDLLVSWHRNLEIGRRGQAPLRDVSVNQEHESVPGPSGRKLSDDLQPFHVPFRTGGNRGESYEICSRINEVQLVREIAVEQVLSGR